MAEILTIGTEKGDGYYRPWRRLPSNPCARMVESRNQLFSEMRHPVAVSLGSGSTASSIRRRRKFVRKLVHSSIHRL